MALKFKSMDPVTVGTAGTAEQVASAFAPATTVVFQADEDNTGKAYVGDESVDSSKGISLDPGEVFTVTADLGGRKGGEELDLSDFYIDAETTGNKVKILYAKRK